MPAAKPRTIADLEGGIRVYKEIPESGRVLYADLSWAFGPIR